MSPTLRIGLSAGALLAAFAAGGLLRRGGPDPAALRPELFLEAAPGGARVSDPSSLPRAEVLSVVDGDTLHVRWRGRDERLRYFGVDTPEIGEPCHDEAAHRNGELAGREVLLAFDDRARDVHGRMLAYVFTPEGLSLEASLVSEGLGRAWTRDGRWRDAMEAAEKEARRRKRGCLWEKRRR